MFKDNVVAITGAGSGIGRALALVLAEEGARLALSDVNRTALDESIALLPAGVEARAYTVDVSSRESVFGFADNVKRDFGTVHVVVNNAGTSVIASVEHLTLDEIARVMNINLWGVIHGTKAFLPILLAQREGCIVNMSSVFGLVAVPAQAAYTMTKFAVRGLTETLWQELDGTGVRAVLVHPGGINTRISNNAVSAQHEGDYERRLARAFNGQMTTSPEECARQIVSGLGRGDRRLVVGNGARAIHRISRLFPDNYGALMRRKLGV